MGSNILPEYFTKSNEASPSYDWFDYATGSGYRTFYACASQDNAGSKYFLTPQQVPSSHGLTYMECDAAETTEVNFDLQFNSPVIVKGDLLIYYTHRNQDTETSNTIVTIYHVNLASTETSIGTATHTAKTGGGAPETYRECLKITLTEKSFAIGEKLRVEFKLVSNAANAYVFHDPESRQTFTETTSGATIGTDMVVHIPFKIDL